MSFSSKYYIEINPSKLLNLQAALFPEESSAPVLRGAATGWLFSKE